MNEINNAVLKAESLKKYYGSYLVLDSLNIEMYKGKILGLLGENGAGKSTTISILISQIKADSGFLYYKGRPVSDCLKEYRSKLAYVPQEISLFEELSGMENLLFWARAYGLKGNSVKKKINEISEMFGLSDELNKKTLHYSGGYQRRLNIACALLHEPEILFLDEPTVGIDVLARNNIIKIVKDLAKSGVSILYTSHYIAEIEAIADSISILKKGKCISNLGPAELSEIKNLEEYYLNVAL